MSRPIPHSRLLLSGETREFFAPYMSRNALSPLSHRQMATQLIEQPGRFRSTLPFSEKLRLKAIILNPYSDTFFGGHSLSVWDPSLILPAWQVLLRYLAQQGIIEDEPWLGRSSHDSPKLSSVRFYLQGLDRKGFSGGSQAFDLETAFSKALGEALERFFMYPTKLAHHRVDVRASTAGMKHHKKMFVDPETLSQFSREQREQSKRLQFDETSVFAWTRVSELVSGQRVFVPAQCFSLERFSVGKEHEPLLREQNTNAAAGGFTLEEALLSALYEAVERDGFLVYWLNTIAPVRLDVSECQDDDFLKLLAQLERYQLEAHFLDTTTDIGIPSCICVLIDRSGAGPGVALGGGCSFHLESMLRSSLLEALSVHGSFHRIGTPRHIPGTGDRPFCDKEIDLHERVRIWKQPEMFPKLDFFLSGEKKPLAEVHPKRKVFSSAGETLEYVKGIFRSFGPGYEIYYYEAKHEVLDTIGYHVVKVLIPELVGMYLYEVNAGLGARRLKSAPQKMGRTSSKQWNPWPHPFP